MTDHATIVTETRGGVFLIGLDRPARRNALDVATVSQFHAALDQAGSAPCVLVVHSTTPGIFAAGADIDELLQRRAEDALRRITMDLLDRLERHRWPTIAAVDGPAFGAGSELALACDLRVCSPRARFAQPESSLGILAGAGGNWRLTQLVGLAAARRMLYLGETVDADAARALGLVDEIADDPLAGALTMADTIASRSWRALEFTKLALALDRPTTGPFDAVAQALLFESDDKQERMQEFIDRRQARAAARKEGADRGDS